MMVMMMSGASEMLKNAGVTALFFSIYFPLVVSYVLGKWNWISDLFAPVPANASALVKYGEMYDD